LSAQEGDVSFHDPSFHRVRLTILASRNALPADLCRIISQIEAAPSTPNMDNPPRRRRDNDRDLAMVVTADHAHRDAGDAGCVVYQS
jgi:hypothetical protein